LQRHCRALISYHIVETIDLNRALIVSKENSRFPPIRQTGDGGKIRPETIANISKQHLKETTATNLGEVSAIGNPQFWRPSNSRRPTGRGFVRI
jgi:hypothetical protein